MTAPTLSPEDRLVDALAREARGPRRNGIYAMWLFTRVARGLVGPHPVSARAHRRRLELLQHRLSSLSVPPPLRRALTAGIKRVADGTPQAAAIALQQLTAPARETVGAAVAEAIGAAAREALAGARQREDG
ncbi:MAG TPA: hypothetical protein VGA37_01385 [Gemmatimonadales bacterium]